MDNRPVHSWRADFGACCCIGCSIVGSKRSRKRQDSRLEGSEIGIHLSLQFSLTLCGGRLIFCDAVDERAKQIGCRLDRCRNKRAHERTSTTGRELSLGITRGILSFSSNVASSPSFNTAVEMAEASPDRSPAL